MDPTQHRWRFDALAAHDGHGYYHGVVEATDADGHVWRLLTIQMFLDPAKARQEAMETAAAMLGLARGGAV